MRHLLLTACAVAALAACSPKAEAPPAKTGETPAAAPAVTPVKSDAPAGEYFTDAGHTSLIFRVSHMGFSNYTARFTKVDAKLNFDPANPAGMSVTATIDPRSLETDYPDPKVDFDAELAGPNWLDAAKFPQITFESTRVDVTGANTARVTGDLTLHGITKPVAFDVTFNGGYAGNAMDPGGSRIGFSAKGSLKRSDFGVAYGIPAPGSNMGVGDLVQFELETEMLKPKDPAAAIPPAAPKS